MIWRLVGLFALAALAVVLACSTGSGSQQSSTAQTAAPVASPVPSPQQAPTANVQATGTARTALESDAQKHVDAAIDHRNAGRLGLAVSELQQALGLIYDYAPARAMYGEVVAVATAEVQQVRAQQTMAAQPSAIEVVRPSSIPVPTPVPTDPPATTSTAVVRATTLKQVAALDVGDTLQTFLDGSPASLTLVSVADRTLLRNSGSRREFETTFAIANRSTSTISFRPSEVLVAANSSGRRLSRGSAVRLEPQGPVVVRSGAETTGVLRWNSETFYTVGGAASALTIWIAVNTPVDENLGVTVRPWEGAGVFSFTIPEIPR